MKLRMILIALCLTALVSCKAARNAETVSDSLFYGQDVTLAEINICANLYVDIPQTYKGAAATIRSAPEFKEIEDRVSQQLDFLSGVLMNYREFKTHPATPYGSPKVNIYQIEAVPANPKVLLVRYTFTDKAVFSNEFFNTRQGWMNTEMVLPAYLTGFLEKAKVKVTDKDGDSNIYNKCSEEEDSDDDKFWYYWDVDHTGCPLVRGKDYIVVNAVLKALPNTAQTSLTHETFPWYDKMFGEAARQPATPGKFNIIWNILPDSPSQATLKRTKGQDTDQYQMDEAVQTLTSSYGFKIASQSHHHVTLELKKPLYTTTLKILTADDTEDEFRTNVIEGMTKADVFIYSGHSQYGEMLNPKRYNFTASSFDQNKPQLFYFSGCRTFRYYNAKYFELKPKFLNIMATSRPTYGPYANGDIIPFITGLIDDQRPSFQKIISHMNAQEMAEIQKHTEYPYRPSFRSLVTVNGDENNPVTSGLNAPQQ